MITKSVSKVSDIAQMGKEEKVGMALFFDEAEPMAAAIAVRGEGFYVPLKNSVPELLDAVISIFENCYVITSSGQLELKWLWRLRQGTGNVALDLEVTRKMLQVPTKGRTEFPLFELEDSPSLEHAAYVSQAVAWAMDILRIGTQDLEEIERRGMREVLSLEMFIYNLMCSMDRYPVKKDIILTEIKNAEDKIRSLGAEVYHELGTGPFPLNSTQKLGEVLFKKLGLVPIVKTAKGAPSTSMEALEPLKDQHPAISKIMAWRSENSVLSTLKSVWENHLWGDEIKCQWLTLGDDGTSRLYARNCSITSLPQSMRRAFVAPPGKVWMGFDYKAAEFRIFAALSQDPNMIAAIESGEDVHRKTWSLMTETPIEQVADEQRLAAKTILFAVIYSVDSPVYQISRALNKTDAWAKHALKMFFDVYPELEKTRHRLVDEALKAKTSMGVPVTTILGRLRYLQQEKDLSSLKNQIVNTHGQQTCGTILKMAMKNLWLAKNTEPILSSISSMIPVFDALWFTVDENVEVEQFVTEAKARVDWPLGSSLHPIWMESSWSRGPSWGEMAKLV